MSNPAPASNWLLEVGSHTEVGQVRERNEDSLKVDESLGLFVVADGMGGHNAGERASHLAVEELQAFVSSRLDGEVDPETLAAAFHRANAVIFRESLEQPERRGMGTTMTALLFRADVCWIGHVGDSRAWRFRDGVCKQLTEDHSVIGDQIRQGILTPEQALHHPMRSVLTRSLGNGAEVTVDVLHGGVQDGDLFILGTDGMTRVLDEAGIGQRAATAQDPGSLASDLVEFACTEDGTDNVTVIVVRCSAAS